MLLVFVSQWQRQSCPAGIIDDLTRNWHGRIACDQGSGDTVNPCRILSSSNPPLHRIAKTRFRAGASGENPYLGRIRNSFASQAGTCTFMSCCLIHVSFQMPWQLLLILVFMLDDLINILPFFVKDFLRPPDSAPAIIADSLRTHCGLCP